MNQYSPISDPNPPSFWSKLVSFISKPGVLIPIVVICFVVLLVAIFKKPVPTSDTSQTLPAFSSPPIIIAPEEQIKNVKFIWNNVSIPDFGSPGVYRISETLSAKTGLTKLIELLELIRDEDSLSWKGENGSLSLGDYPQYIHFIRSSGAKIITSPSQVAISISPYLLTSQSSRGLVPIRDPMTGKSSQLPVIKSSIYQEIDGITVMGLTSNSIGEILIDDKGFLYSINIAGGYRSIAKVADGIIPSTKEFQNLAESTAVHINSESTISDQKQYYLEPHNITILNISPTFYSSPNSLYILPGYLLSGANGSGKNVYYFVALPTKSKLEDINPSHKPAIQQAPTTSPVEPSPSPTPFDWDNLVDDGT